MRCLQDKSLKFTLKKRVGEKGSSRYSIESTELELLHRGKSLLLFDGPRVLLTDVKYIYVFLVVWITMGQVGLDTARVYFIE